MFKKKNDTETHLPYFGSTPGLVDILIVVLLAFMAFLFFDQWYDMAYTSQQSGDLLDLIFAGKPFDFYGYVITQGAAGQYFPLLVGNPTVAAAYNILVYIVLAVWELPIYVINHIVPIHAYELMLGLWSRMLGIILIGVCYRQFTRLSEDIMSDRNKAKWAGYYFLSSPLIIFCVIIRNQLDIIPVLLIILALRQYFKKNFISFCLLMSVASCFKMMPFFIVIPLLFLAEKRIGKLVKYIAASLSIYAATNIICYLADPGYSLTQDMIMKSDAFSKYIFKVIIPGGDSNTSVFLLIYFLICVIAYVVRPMEKDLPFYAILFGFSSLSVFFLFVKWHPQWVLLLLPFIVLLVFSLMDFEFGILLDISLITGFLLINILLHPICNVFAYSIFCTITNTQYVPPVSSDPIYTFCMDHGITTIIPSTLFFAGIVALILVAFLNNRSKSTKINSSFDNSFKIHRGLLYARTAIILIYMVPPIVSYLSHPIV